MLSEDAPYESWAADQGLDGVTDFHIADSPFYYTGGWDFVAVSSSPPVNVFSVRLPDSRLVLVFLSIEWNTEPSSVSCSEPKGIGLREIFLSLFRIPATQHMY